jgi:hypothetical protein
VLGGPCNRYSEHSEIVGQGFIVTICQILLLPRHEDAGVKIVCKVVVGGKLAYVDIMNFTDRMDIY